MKYTIPVLFYIEDDRPEEYVRELVESYMAALKNLVGVKYEVGIGVFYGQEDQLQFVRRMV